MKQHWSEEIREEYQLARSQCAFESEWFSGTHKAMPNHIKWKEILS